MARKKKIKLDYDSVIVLKGEEGLKNLYHLFEEKPFRSVVLEMHPDIAQIILKEFHGKNRNPNKRNKQKQAKDFLSGKWAVTGDTIKFSDDGEVTRLIDGQHRLMACIDSKKPLFSHAVFGLNPNIFTFIDSGQVRRIPDVLSMVGINQTAHRVAAMRKIKYYDEGSDPRIWTADDALEMHSEIKEVLDECLKFYTYMKKAYDIPPTPVITLDYLIRRSRPRLSDLFFNAALYEKAKARNEVFTVFRTRMLRLIDNREVTVKPETVLSYLIITFNHWAKCEPMTSRSLLWKTGDTLPRLDFKNYKPYE